MDVPSGPVRVPEPVGRITDRDLLNAYWGLWLQAHDARNEQIAGAAACLIKGWGAQHANRAATAA